MLEIPVEIKFVECCLLYRMWDKVKYIACKQVRDSDEIWNYYSEQLYIL
jgi:hypothetical protein